MQNNSITTDFYWKPGANTVGYRPLSSSSTINDMKTTGTKYNLTNAGGVSFGIYQGIDCASFNGASNGQLYSTAMSFGSSPKQTVAVLFYVAGTSTSVYQTIYHTGTTIRTGKLGSRFKYNTGLCLGSRDGSYEVVKSGNINGGRHILINITDGNSSKQYLDGVLYQSFTNSLTGTMTGIYIGGAQNSTSERLTGGIANVVLENIARTEAFAIEFTNKTKRKYGLQ